MNKGIEWAKGIVNKKTEAEPFEGVDSGFPLNKVSDKRPKGFYEPAPLELASPIPR